MNLVLNAVLTAASALVVLPLAVLCVELWLALLPSRRRARRDKAPRPATAVLMPAHNEQLVIGETLARLRPQLRRGDRVVVVADNCDDGTAEVARKGGAEVLERAAPDRRGKGYALDFGVRYLESDPPDVVAVVDADCRVSPDFLDVVSRLAHSAQRPVQSLNLSQPGPVADRIRQVTILGNRLVNWIRPRGQARIGMPCRLMGTGMAFPWRFIREADLGRENLVEDLQLGIDLAIGGGPALFCSEARVTSALPPGRRAFMAQRRRWEHGYLRTAIVQIPRLLLAAARQRRLELAWMALDLSIPPLALLAILWLAAFAAAAALRALTWAPLALLGAGGAAAFVSIGVAWFAFCRREVSAASLCAAPFYVIRKLPIYSALLVRRQKEWVRTERRPASTRLNRAAEDTP